MSKHNSSDSSPPMTEPLDEKIGEEVNELATLPIEEHWLCVACEHYEIFSKIRCGSCLRFRALFQVQENLVVKVPKSQQQITKKEEPGIDEQELLDLAFKRLQSLFQRAQKEGRTFSGDDRAQLYETLLLSFLKIEREEVRKYYLHHILQEEREERKRSHMIHLSIIWFLGICTGFALYFALESVY